jgi:hypothetical protein
VRLAACAALLSFALLPHGHLRGHEEIAAARAWVRAPASSLGAAPVGLPESPGRKGCSLCLSLARVRDALAKSDGPALAVAAAAARLSAPCAERGPEAPSLPHACPRAPPSA